MKKTIKPRSAKSGSSKKKVPSDVSPATSLPPLVEGHLRCFLRVTVSRLVWTIHKPPQATFVRLRWWGESSNGTQFWPRDGSQVTQKTVKTTTRFPVRCGPKQFISYLSDMGSLVLEVLTKLDHLPIARAQVAGISRLSLSHSISGFYTLVSPTSEKLGEIQVALSLEPLAEACDSSSSLPTMDTSTGAPLPPAQPPQRSASSLGAADTPRGKDHLYFPSAQLDKGKGESFESQGPTLAGGPRAHSEQPSTDLLSVILERGSKLRNAMVRSALQCDLDVDTALKDTPLPLPRDNVLPASKLLSPSYGGFLQNLLQDEASLQRRAGPDQISPSCPADIENRAVDLLLGRLNTSLPVWDGMVSPPESPLSGHSSVCLDSELNDPQYDQSLLENLFYKTPTSDSHPEVKETMSQSQSQETSSTGHRENQLRSHRPPDPGEGDTLAGVAADQLKALSRIRLARVTLHSLGLPPPSPRRTTGKGRHPRPLVTKRCSYCVEYTFPVAPVSSRHTRGSALVEEVTRAVSAKVSGGEVTFEQRTVFPVSLVGDDLQRYRETEVVFNLYSRNKSQQKPVPVGKAVYPLRCLLEREWLSQSVVLPVQRADGAGESQEIGPLKVSLDLAADNKGFIFAKRGPATTPRSPSHTQASPRRDPSPRPDPSPRRYPSPRPPSRAPLDRGPSPADHAAETSVRAVHWASQGPYHHPGPQEPPRGREQYHGEDDGEILLHALLMVPDGKEFVCGPLEAPNFYLNCRLFGSDQTARSTLTWGQRSPEFNFVQVTPVALTPRLLERMKNNVMVVEVWQRTGSTGQDRVLGLVKLPLHQFYMSFRDPKVCQLLLRAQYPVLGADGSMPVIDVFSGGTKGSLRVMLAMGGSEQILALQRMRDEEASPASRVPRPVHLPDQQPRSRAREREAMIEHLFAVRVEKVQGLSPLESTVWGEADCYVQYSFPSQEGEPASPLDPQLIESSVDLKQFRTPTSLCVPDPLFGHSETHVLLAPAGTPVQRLLLSALSGQAGGGVQFEVWCRYYYPNVREQRVARGLLPLSKLCAMVTLQGQRPAEAQLFSLPLARRGHGPEDPLPQPSGVLDVYIQYRQRPVRAAGHVGAGMARVVTLNLQVHRASGLKAAARALAEQDERFRYFADVGPNSYVTAQLSFLPDGEGRSTRVVARSFCPEFEHHAEVPCDLDLQRSTGETRSLAEVLEQGSARFTLWHRDSPKGPTTPKSEDRLLGTVKIPLNHLLLKRTGISGWFGVQPPRPSSSTIGPQGPVGGLEVSLGFAHHSDRARVLAAARALGWCLGPRGGDDDDDDDQGDEDDEDVSTGSLSLSVSTPRAWLPVHCLLLAGEEALQRSTYCYLRYQLYDREAFCSPLRHPALEEGGQRRGLATLSFQGCGAVKLVRCRPLLWYLREERLELQLWVAFGKHKARRPHDTDRLVGSAFVDLSPLAAEHNQNLSGVYPLFRHSASDLSGAALRVHIAMTTGSLPGEAPALIAEADSQEELLQEVEEEEVEPDPGPSSTSQSHGPSSEGTNHDDPAAPQQTGVDAAEDSFPVTITVDRAMHLSLKGCPKAEHRGSLPSCSVSYLTADGPLPVSTPLVADSSCPVWEHHHECRLSKQLLVDPLQSLVFKVWHKGDMERVLGFASVDLSPLLSGFQAVCGWYNITDFSGQCQGQLKVSVSPLKGVQGLRGQRQPLVDQGSNHSSALFQGLPLGYQTSATYSSFPAHLSRFPEQKISSPERTDQFFSQRPGESDRHGEHMDNIRLFHQSLQEQVAGDGHPSSSILFSALRKNLSELDDMQKYFSHKLSTPGFPPACEPARPPSRPPSRPQEEGHPETSTHQLLLKSSQLVGEVNHILSGLQGPRPETLTSEPQGRASSPPAPGDRPLVGPSGTSPERDSHAPLQRAPEPPRHHDGSPPEEGLHGHGTVLSEGEDGEDYGAGGREEEEAGGGGEEEENDDEDGSEVDYDEMVVEPRPLNEVSSLTDRTSPWTSVFSGCDLSSAESLGDPEEGGDRAFPDPAHAEVVRRLWGPGAEGPDLQGTCEDTSGAVLEEGEHCECDHSTGPQSDASNSEREEVEQTLQASGEEEEVKPAVMNQGGQGSVDEPDGEPLTPPHTEEQPPPASAGLGEIPNFFLSSNHLEASMRALRLAPAFSRPPSNPGPGSAARGLRPPRRAPRPRPTLPAGSMKAPETARIARIFAAHFGEDQ